MAEQKTPPFNPEIKEQEDESEEDESLKNKKSEENVNEEKETKEEEPEEKDEIEEKDIPTRENVQQHIITRQKRTIQKLRSKDEEEPEVLDDDDALSPEAQGAVSKEVNKAIAPLTEQLAKNVDEREIEGLLKSEPESMKYEKRIRAYMKVHPTITPSMAFHHLAFESAASIGSKRKKNADTEADQDKGGGRTLRPKKSTGNLPSVEDIDEMSDAELETMQGDIERGKYNNKE